MQKWRGQDKFLSALPRPSAGPYAVEKLFFRKMLKKNFALGCPTNDFLDFLGILYTPNFGCFGVTRTFSTAQAITLKSPDN